MHILDESEVEKTFVERDPALPSAQSALPPARPLIGQTRIGFGLVVDTIGVGGMAAVYKVWNERLELFRAIKMLSTNAPHARFETEAKITAKLRHPHIVEVYNVGEWNGVPYMEMEYVDGVNLQEALEARGRLPDAVCCAVGLCIASALSYAHTLKFTLGGNSYNGIIHRDLKPANVLVSKRSEIKLTDFGIARPAQAGLHTIDGNIVGTLHYLSPEQLGNGKTDPRSDIYSFGTILYEMATGVKTFPQKSITELTMRRAANTFKSPSEYDSPPVAPAISNIILKCLKTSQDERYGCAAELIRDLQKAYAEIAKGCAPQKTLYEFFAENTGETDVNVHPTVLITVDGAHINGIGTDITGADINTTDEVTAANDTGQLPSSPTTAATATGEHSSPLHILPNEQSRINTDDVIGTNDIVGTDIIGADINTTDEVTAANDTGRLPSSPTTAATATGDIDTSINTDNVIGTNATSTNRKRTIVYASIALFSMLLALATYLTVKLISRPQPTTTVAQASAAAKFFSTDSASAVADTAGGNTADVSAIAVNTTNINTAPVDTIANTIIDTVSVNVAAKAPPPAPISESALIKNASEAIGRKEWDRAIRILEKNGAAFTERRGDRHLLLLEAYVESRQLDKARTVLDSAAATNDALYFLTAGRYMFYRNDHAGALTALEASLTRSSALRSRNTVLGDALYYIALIRSDRFKASPTETARKQAQEAWRRVRSAYESRPESPQFKRAEAEVLELY